LSIVENTALMGVPCPAFVKTALETLKDKNDKAINDDAGD
jgi:phage-related holin